MYCSTFNVINVAGEFSVPAEVHLSILWGVGSLVTNNTIFYFIYVYIYIFFIFYFNLFSFLLL